MKRRPLLSFLFGVILSVLIDSSFAWKVLLALPKTTKLSWTGPTTTVDGQPINADTALTGYKVYCGVNSNIYTILKDVGIVTIYPAIDIPLISGVWYCVITASNKYGESGYSNEKRIDFDAIEPGTVILMN